MKKTIIISIIFLCFHSVLNAQDFSINQEGTHTSCAINFFDSDSLGLYQNNESYTITFCSDGSGQSNIINLGFDQLFKIDPSDTLFVFDGNSITSPLIGAYNNNNAPTGVSSTTTNTSGCLTFHFVSDGANVDSGWVASSNCVKICQPIIPVITTTPAMVSYSLDSNYTNICPGDSVFFSGSANYPDNGVNSINYSQSDATSTFEWNFGEGTEITAQTGGVVYDNEGGYVILLKVTDANNCLQQIIHKVKTGIIPDFSSIFALPDTSCFGDTVQLNGGFNSSSGNLIGVSANSGVFNVGGIVAGQTFLPDDNGTNPYTTSVGISGFSGVTINSVNDIQEICLNMEHSYNGDLSIVLECPNGQSMELFYGSGGAIMGEPVAEGLPIDNNTANTAPGIGYDYCFNPTATNGVPWNNTILLSTYTDVQGHVSTNVNQIPAGDYEASGNWTDLLGCPVDGNWTIIVTDNVSADNGYIFEWGITLNPAINPNAELYNVAIVDGQWLTTTDLIASYDTMSVVLPQGEGDHQYVFQVTDEYGCSFDTTINVNVLPEIIAIASPDTNLCQGQQVTFDVGGATSNCNYTVELFDSWGDGWDGGGYVNVFINGTLFLSNQTVADCNGNTTSGCDASFTVNITSGDIITFDYVGGNSPTENTITVFDGDGNQVFFADSPVDGILGPINADCAGGLAFSWWPATDLSDPTIPNPIFSGSTTSTYAVQVSLNNHPECSVTSDSITIIVTNNVLPTITGDSAICFGSSSTYTINGADSILWANGSNDSTITFTPQNDSLLVVTALTACGTISWNKHVVVYPKIDLTATPDTVICEGQAVSLNLNGVLNECTYLLTLIDSAGNGWGNFEGVDVKINGVLYETGVTVLDCNVTTCQYSMVIPVNNGDVLSLEYTSGASDVENSIILFDASNAPIYNITNPIAGVLGTFTANCSNAYNISWSPSIQLSDPTVINPIFSAVSSQTYQSTVYLLANPNCINTSNSINVEVRSIDIPVIIGDTSICNGETITLSINADSVLWWGDTTNVNTSFTFTPQSDSLVTVTASTFCIEDTVVTHFVEVNPLPTIITIPDTTLTIQQTITLTTVGGVSYYWTPDLYLSCNDCSDPIASPIESTSYNVVVTDSNGCVSSKSINIEVLIPDLFIPTGFSPNNDGVNDIIVVRSLSIASMSIQIFDRWGGLVFESDKQERGWDGTANGEKLDAGVYVYKFEARLVSGEKVEQAGNITLFR
ncbi:MAG: gliding motility-associated C-terminal domain-containing protein [Bacteroidetes bacterium]|nr:gliding motility-associated C-terminal domain-containing protein [Bacteroidota bacterium]